MAAKPVFTVVLRGRAAKLLARAKEFGDLIVRAIARAHDEQNDLTVGAIVEKRLSFSKRGPPTLEGLRAQDSHLRRSIRRSPALIDGEKVVSSIGSNIRYAAVHEFGFQGRVRVRAKAHLEVLRGRRKVRVARKVKAHTRQMNLPARQYIQRTMRERTNDYRDAMERHVIAAVDKP